MRSYARRSVSAKPIGISCQLAAWTLVSAGGAAQTYPDGSSSGSWRAWLPAARQTSLLEPGRNFEV